MFVCVLRTGGIYTKDHVVRLQEQLDRPLNCLSDVDFSAKDIHVMPLLHNWPGWWSKIEVFRLHGPITYLDLDVDIVGDPDRLNKIEFTMWQDPFYPTGHNSSVMSWLMTPKNVYTRFKENPEKPMRSYRRWPKAGDQGFIADNVPKINTYEDGLILSYKAHVKKGVDTKDASVIAYHGKPKPWELQ